MGKIFRLIVTGVVFFVLLSENSYAQIEPPQLLCIKGDTLNWLLPPPITLPCGGGSVTYDIYHSTSLPGPYSLLNTVTDPTQTQFIHTGSIGINYYYLVTNTNCPGHLSTPSDTLSNLSPLEPDFLLATVNGSNVELEWAPGPSPQVYAHIIYRATQSGTIPIDTVYMPSTTYTDLTSDINSKAEHYYVVSLDPCGNTSGFIELHKTIFVEGSIDACLRTATLQWDPYLGFSGDVEYELLISIDGIVQPVVDITSGGSGFTIVNNILDETDYCFTISAREVSSGYTSLSNVFCIRSEVSTPVYYFYYDQMTVTDDEVLITAKFNPEYEFSLISLSTADNPLLSPSQTSILDDEILNGLISLNYPLPSGTPLHLSFSTEDVCSNITNFDTLSTIYLSGEVNPDGSNTIQWTDIVWPGSTLEAYNVWFYNGSNFEHIHRTSSNTFNHIVPHTGGEIVSYCYKVVASMNIPVLNGTLPRNSESNIFCIDKESEIFMPNAISISAGGINARIRPIIKYPESVDNYEFRIFDRFGNNVFSSTDMSEEWDGHNSSGRQHQNNLYVYTVKITLRSGQEISKKGTFLIVR